MARAVIESEAQPAGVQPKRIAKFLTVIGLTTIHAICHITRKTLSTQYLENNLSYESVSINNQPIPFSIDRDGHDFHALFQYMFYTWVQNCTRIESFFNKVLNVKHG